MGGGNGAKSKQARERAQKNAPKAGVRGGQKSTKLKCNGVSKSGKAGGCFTFFMPTDHTRMEQHHKNDHPSENAATLYIEVPN